MEEYADLLKLGFVVALVLLVGLVLRLMGVGKKKKGSAKGRKESKGKAAEESYYQQEAYVDDGGEGGEWEDSDMHAMKEGKSKSGGFYQDEEKSEKKEKKEKQESWDDY